MLMTRLKYFISKYFHLRNRDQLAQIAVIGEGSLIDRLQLENRANYFDNQIKRLKIGSNCVMECRIVFENAFGNLAIGNRSYIGSSLIVCTTDISIGQDVLISWGCTLIDTDAHSLFWKERENDVQEWRKSLMMGKVGFEKKWDSIKSLPIHIEDKAWIGFNSIILKGVTIGEGAIVASGSVVTKHVAAYTLVGGNPARFIKNLEK